MFVLKHETPDSVIITDITLDGVRLVQDTTLHFVVAMDIDTWTIDTGVNLLRPDIDFIPDVDMDDCLDPSVIPEEGVSIKSLFITDRPAPDALAAVLINLLGPQVKLTIRHLPGAETISFILAIGEFETQGVADLGEIASWVELNHPFADV